MMGWIILVWEDGKGKAGKGENCQETESYIKKRSLLRIYLVSPLTISRKI